MYPKDGLSAPLVKLLHQEEKKLVPKIIPK